MTKREYCMKNPAIAYYSGLNGLEIHGIEYGIEDYIYCVSGAWGGGKAFHRFKILKLLRISGFCGNSIFTKMRVIVKLKFWRKLTISGLNVWTVPE